MCSERTPTENIEDHLIDVLYGALDNENKGKWDTFPRFAKIGLVFEAIKCGKLTSMIIPKN